MLTLYQGVGGHLDGYLTSIPQSLKEKGTLMLRVGLKMPRRLYLCVHMPVYSDVTEYNVHCLDTYCDIKEKATL